MTIPRIEAIGFCAHYSETGDWAFAYALKLAQEHGLQLNVFHFLSDPYQPDDETLRRLPAAELAERAFVMEREMRLYYDRLAGDFLDIGFRLCHDNSWRELHRCLAGREFQLLVLARPHAGAGFAGKPMDEFANSFVCPVVLVGPDRPDRFSLNSSAALLADRIDIPTDTWRRIGIGAV